MQISGNTFSHNLLSCFQDLEVMRSPVPPTPQEEPEQPMVENFTVAQLMSHYTQVYQSYFTVAQLMSHYTQVSVLLHSGTANEPLYTGISLTSPWPS